MITRFAFSCRRVPCEGRNMDAYPRIFADSPTKSEFSLRGHRGRSAAEFLDRLPSVGRNARLRHAVPAR